MENIKILENGSEFDGYLIQEDGTLVYLTTADSRPATLEESLLELKRKATILFHFKLGLQVDGPHKGLTGDHSNIFGDCSGLNGDCSGLRGNVTYLSGRCTDMTLNCSGLMGNIYNFRN